SNSFEEPVVATNAQSTIVAWDGQTGNSSATNVYARLYHSGQPVGDFFQVNSAGSQEDNPSVTIDAAGDFVVVWTDETGLDGSGRGVFAQRYNAGGAPQGGQFQVNVQFASDQHTSSSSHQNVAMDANGNFVVVWTDT